MNEFKGYSLFNDIQDVELRTRNRAVILCNIIEQNTKQRLITPRGTALVLGYFSNVPKEEREAVQSKFITFMKERGYVPTNVNPQQ